MDSQTSSKRLMFLVFLTSFLNFLLILDVKVLEYSNFNQSAGFLETQSQLREVSSQLITEGSSLGNLGVQFSEALNDFNRKLVNRELINGTVLSSIFILSLLTCLFAGFGMILPEGRKKWLGNLNLSKEKGQETVESSAMEKVISDINSAADNLVDYVGSSAQQSDGKNNSKIFESQFDEAISMSAQVKGLDEEIGTAQSSFAEIHKLLQKASTQCGDSASFSSATRMEWGNLGVKLRQLREQQNKARSLSDKLTKVQSTNAENISNTLQFIKTHNKHSEDVRSDLAQLLEQSKQGNTQLSEVSESIKVSQSEVNRATKLVTGLSERAEAIVDIIDVIDDIAEQTNQLALNASIEAARAGEQGQGFAVVAGEVRNLAARSSTATKSITDLLGTIQEEAEEASKLLTKSDEAVTSSSEKISDVEEAYRKYLALSRHAQGGIEVLKADVSQHFSTLQTVEKSSNEAKKLAEKLAAIIEEQGSMNSSINNEGNQLTAHSDRTSRLLSRQFHEIDHCQQLLDINMSYLSSIKNRAAKTFSSAQNIKGNLDILYKESLAIKQRSHNHTINAMKNIQVLRSSSQTLSLIHRPELAKNLSEEINRNVEKYTMDSLKQDDPPSTNDSMSEKVAKESKKGLTENVQTSQIAHLPDEDLVISDKSKRSDNAS